FTPEIQKIVEVKDSIDTPTVEDTPYNLIAKELSKPKTIPKTQPKT
ncbi:22265_t:CDS:1, partial [Racocetra persica]